MDLNAEQFANLVNQLITNPERTHVNEKPCELVAFETGDFKRIKEIWQLIEINPVLPMITSHPNYLELRNSIIAQHQVLEPSWRFTESKDHYTIIRQLGCGSAGTVNLVADSSGQLWAQKIGYRMKEEIAIHWRLTDLNIRGIPHFREAYYPLDWLPAHFLISEYLPGDIVESSQQLTMQLRSDLIDIVHALHSHGITHWDLGGHNVIISNGQVYVIDFSEADETLSSVDGFQHDYTQLAWLIFGWRDTKLDTLKFDSEDELYKFMVTRNKVY